MFDDTRRENFVDGTDYDPQKRPRFSEIATFMRAPWPLVWTTSTSA